MNRDERFQAEAMPEMRIMYGIAYRLTRNAFDAEDLVQETYLRAYRAFDRYSPGTNIRAWLSTILHRVRTDMLRKSGRSPNTVELKEEGPAVPTVPAVAERVMASGREDVLRALDELPEVFRAAVVLRDVEDFSYDEIARIIEAPIGTVMSRIHRGRALLRKALGEKKP